MTPNAEPVDPRAIFTGADVIVAPEWLLLPEGPTRDHAVHLSAGSVFQIGPREELARVWPGVPLYELPRRLLMPGFVDTHHHLTQSLGKAMAFGEPSEIFRRIWVPLEGSLDERSLYLSAKLAMLEALRGGFTTVCDAGTRAAAGVEGIVHAARETGIRCVLGLTCNDDGSRHDETLRAAELFLLGFQKDPLIHPSLAVSIPEAATDRMLQAVSRLCGEARAVFQVHVNEHLASVERSLVARGQRPLEHLHAAGALGPQALIAHATMLTPRELGLLRETDTAVAFNPVASAWKGNAVANAVLMSELGVRVGLGTDGTRSDGFRLMDAAETSQRLAHGLAIGDSSCGGGRLWLEQATAGGADVAGLGGRTGSIETLCAADLLVIDLDVPEMLPSWDLGWELVRLASRDQIEAVIVDGRLRLYKGWPTDWSARALMREVEEIARSAVARAPIQKIHPASFAQGRRR